MNFVKYLLFYMKLLYYLFCNMFGSVLECYELTGVGLLWTRRALAIKAQKSIILFYSAVIIVLFCVMVVS